MHRDSTLGGINQPLACPSRVAAAPKVDGVSSPACCDSRRALVTPGRRGGRENFRPRVAVVRFGSRAAGWEAVELVAELWPRYIGVAQADPVRLVVPISLGAQRDKHGPGLASKKDNPVVGINPLERHHF